MLSFIDSLDQFFVLLQPILDSTLPFLIYLLPLLVPPPFDRAGIRHRLKVLALALIITLLFKAILLAVIPQESMEENLGFYFSVIGYFFYMVIYVGLRSFIRPRKKSVDPILRKQRFFLSYRRDDSLHSCGRLYEKLAQDVGKDRVFRDVYNIDIGEDFREKITSSMQDCDFALVLIGTKWMDFRDRLEKVDDPVRMEIELMRNLGLKIVPCLIDNATMPSAEDLPESIRYLVDITGARLRP
ncbi:MAG: toll/interleukin-1 receptor domain-containing protein, partial [Verrucomicrobiota bacterium]